MAFSYKIDAVRRLVIVHGSGVLTIEDLRAYTTALRADPQFGDGFSQIVMLDIAESRITFQDWMSYKEWLEGGPKAPQIAVVTHGDFVFGAARQYEMTARRDQQAIRVFRDVGAAAEWLGLDAKALDLG